MKLTVDPGARSPLYQQIQDQVRYAVSVGELSPGESLPSIRTLETRLGINRNTVRRAYLELQTEGVLELRQGREARVARHRPDTPSAGDGRARDLASRALLRAEACGVDGLRLAELIGALASEHDARYPRCAVIECNPEQAQAFGQAIERVLGRHVIGLDLHALEHDRELLPASIRCVLTPHWHLGAVRSLVTERSVDVQPFGVQLAPDCERRLRSWHGRRVALIVRDGESAPGYREQIEAFVGRGQVDVVVARDLPTVTLPTDSTGVGAAAVPVAGAPVAGARASGVAAPDAVVFTTPCRDLVRTRLQASVDSQELVFEPLTDDLRTLAGELVPAHTGSGDCRTRT